MDMEVKRRRRYCSGDTRSTRSGDKGGEAAAAADAAGGCVENRRHRRRVPMTTAARQGAVQCGDAPRRIEGARGTASPFALHDRRDLELDSSISEDLDAAPTVTIRTDPQTKIK
ncbi:hypothetical protein B0H14DRAFT_2610470 [Mycena olivaceomarginata]|nr:hypothetical protein B0H14DRAFT_2610470 [Mycena olivaceomarginata]